MDNAQKRPTKGILKNSSSFDKQENQPNAKKAKATKWDEMNIIATLHPPDKDYGHMKIAEPKTPFNYDVDDLDATDAGIDAQDLAEKITLGASTPPKAMIQDPESDSEEEGLTEEEKEKKKEFLEKRKKHYNEFQALQLAKKLMEEDEDEDEDEDKDEDNHEKHVACNSSSAAS